MGMYDIILVFQKCPYCDTYQIFECQTKDLDSIMYVYHSLDENWLDPKDSVLGKDFYAGLPIFKDFPLDKDCGWADQAEFVEARATLPEEFKKLEYVEIATTCQSLWCYAHARLHDKKTIGYISGFGRYFEGKIKIKDGKLIGKVYDLILDNQSEYDELKFLEELKH